MPADKLDYINASTAYEFKEVLTEDTLPAFELPNGWEQDANQLLPSPLRNDPDPHIRNKNLLTHFRADQSYHSRIQLVRSIKFFYAILIDKVVIPGVVLDEELKNQIKNKIMEGIPHCSEGLHNRVNALYGLFFVPKTMPELLQKVRQGIIDIGAYVHRYDDGHTNHDSNVVNYIILQAKNMGYGVQPPNINDNYGHMFIRQNTAQDAVETIFRQKYKPLDILLLLMAEIKNVLTCSYGYRGLLRNESYDIGDYQLFINYLNSLFECNFSDSEILVLDERYIYIVGLNWHLVRQKLWDKAQHFFNFPLFIQPSFNALFSCDDINSQSSIAHLQKLLTLFDSFKDYQKVMNIFSDLSEENQVNLFFYLFNNDNPSENSHLIYELINKNKDNPLYISYLRDLINQKQPYWLKEIENELKHPRYQANYHQTHLPLTEYFTQASGPDETYFFSKFQLLSAQSKLNIILTENNDKLLLQEIMETPFYSRSLNYDSLPENYKKKLTRFKSLPRLFNLLQDLNPEHIDMLFQCHDFYNMALNNNRHSIAALLKLLKQSNTETINYFLSEPGPSLKSRIITLLGLTEDLTKNKNSLSNSPLSEDQIKEIADDVIELVSLLSNEQKQNIFKHIFLCHTDALSLIRQSYLSTKQGKALLSQAPELQIMSVINNQLNTARFEKHLNNTADLLSILSINSAYELLKKTYTQHRTQTSVAYHAFFSEEHFEIFINIYKQLENHQRSELRALIFPANDENSLSKWFENMKERVNLSDLTLIFSALPPEKKTELLTSIIKKAEIAYDNCLILMTGLPVNECLVLFETRVNNGFLSGIFSNKKLFHEKLMADSSNHKALLKFLKSIANIDERQQLQTLLFKDKIDFIVKAFSYEERKRASIDLIMLLPNKAKRKMIIESLRKNSWSNNNIPDYLNIMKGLSTNNLKEILLITPNYQQKSFFQLIIEQKPTLTIRLNRFLNTFENDQERQTFVQKALTSDLIFDSEALLNLTDSLEDLLQLISHFSEKSCVDVLKNLSCTIQKTEDVTLYMDFLLKQSVIKIAEVLQHKNNYNQKTLLEAFTLKPNYKDLTTEALNQLQKIPEAININLLSTFNIKNCQLDRREDEEKVRDIFYFSCQLGLLPKKLAMVWWKSLEEDSAFKLTLLNNALKCLSGQDIELLFSFNNRTQASVLHNYINNGGNLNDDSWLPILDKLSDEIFYPLILEENYYIGRNHYSLLQYLAENNVSSFLKLHSWILNRKKTKLQESILQSQFNLPNHFLLTALHRQQITHTDFVDFMKFRNIKEFANQIFHVLEYQNLHYMKYRNFDKNLKSIFNILAVETSSKEFFSELLLQRNNNNTFLFHSLLENNVDFFDLCFTAFDHYNNETKLMLLTKRFQRHANLYDYYNKTKYKYNFSYGANTESKILSSERETKLISTIASLPAIQWNKCTNNHIDFFYHSKHLQADYSLTPYLLTLNSSQLDAIIKKYDSSNKYVFSFPEKKTLQKVFIELSSNKDNIRTDFFKFIEKTMSPTSIKTLFEIQTMEYGYASNFFNTSLSNHPEQLPYVMGCIDKLAYKEQKSMLLLALTLYKRKITSNSKQWIDLKLQLLSLEEAGDKIPRSKTESHYKAYCTIKKLSTELNKAYSAALKEDRKTQHQTVLKLKELLNAPDTRAVLNEHRDYKKILVNILAAFAGLGIGYLVACSINLYMTNGKHFFFHPQTETDRLADNIIDKIECFSETLRTNYSRGA